MSATPIEIREYRPGDEASIQEAFREVFRESRPMAEWRWKFAEPPLGSRVVLALEPGRGVVCQYSAITVEVESRASSVRAGQIVDVLSRSRGGLARRGAPFLRTVEAFLERLAAPGGYAFIYGFPGVRHQRLGELTGLYNATAEIERFRREVRGGSVRRGSVSPEGRSLESFDAAAIDELWGRASARYELAARRDARWFAWRYVARPLSEYRQFGWRRAGRTRAWAVLRPTRPVAHWVDLVWDGDDANDLAGLAAVVEGEARAQGADEIELWCRGDRAAADVLAARGWASSPDPERRLSAIVLGAGPSLERILTRLYLTQGDSDHV